MDDKKTGAVWFASYPKSGNTWLRFLLEAYRRSGVLDINDMRITTSDGGATIIQGVSPLPFKDLGYRGEMLLRPAALMNLLARLSRPTWVKTHFANVQPEGLPHCIPKEMTEKAVYVVRDPRSVFLSFSKFYRLPIEMTADAMSSEEFTIGGDGVFATQLLGSWSAHVASWVSEKNYPVHVVKYEDMIADAGKELTEVLEFLEQDVDPEIVKLAVEAADIRKLSDKESADGFNESAGEIGSGTFFSGGGTRWENELGPKYIARIEKDHGKVMRLLGYELTKE
jgi:hypothetical protein